MTNMVTAEKRLFLTEDGSRLVPDGDPKAAFLYCAPGQQVNKEQTEKLKGEKPYKSQKKGEDKAQNKGEDK